MDESNMEILASGRKIPSSGVVDFPKPTDITTVIIGLTGRFMHWMQTEAIPLHFRAVAGPIAGRQIQQDGLHITTMIQNSPHFRIICLLMMKERRQM